MNEVFGGTLPDEAMVQQLSHHYWIGKAETLVEFMVRSLVGDPQAVTVSATGIAAGGCTLKVRVALQDRGKVIGKQGRTARSLRTILGAYGGQHGLVLALDIEEPS